MLSKTNGSSEKGIENPGFDSLEMKPEDNGRHGIQTPDADQGGASGPAGSDGQQQQLSDAVDEIQQNLGGYGRYQLIIYFMLSLVYMRGGWHVWVPIYQGWTPAFHCSASPGLSLNDSVPATVGEDGTLTYDGCLQYVNKSVDNSTEPCHNGWTYLWDSDYTSVVSWLDLVCDKEYLVELTTTMYMVGATCGVIFLAPLADVFGSKAMMLACLWFQAVVGTVLIWAKNIIAFCILKFLIGMCNMTIALCAYVLMTETFDAGHREIPTIAMQFFWAVGIMTMALFGYLVPDWKELELTISLPINVLSLLFIFIIPDSIPWLLSKGKIQKAENVIKRFLRINNLGWVPDLDTKLAKFGAGGNKGENGMSNAYSKDTNSEETKHNPEEVFTVLSLFKTPRLRIYTLIMCFLFLVNSLAYFGVMYSTPELNGNRFLNLFFLGLVEVPAYIACIFANRMIGRRISISIFLFISAVCNISVLFIPETLSDGTALHPLRTTLVMVGKFGITGSYSTIYLYASEVYPTVIRNQAVGASSFFENIGSIAAPNMVYVQNSLNNLPLAIFGGMTLVGSFLVLVLPETHGKPLPQTIDDVEKKENKQNALVVWVKERFTSE